MNRCFRCGVGVQSSQQSDGDAGADNNDLRVILADLGTATTCHDVD